MALLYVNGFDSYGTSIGSSVSPSDIFTRNQWAGGVGTLIVRAGRVSDYSLQWTSAGYLAIQTQTADPTLILGLAVKFAALGDATFMLWYSDAYYAVELRVTGDGELAVYRGGTLASQTSGLGLQADTWYYLTLKVVCGATGSYAVYKGTDQVLAASGVDTAGGGSRFVHAILYFEDATLTPTLDDLYMLDGTGSRNNDVLGVMRVATLRASAAGDSTQWTPDSGSNYARVNEAVCDDSASTVQSGTTGDLDLYEYDDLPGTVAGVAGVMVTTEWCVLSGDQDPLKIACRSGETEDDSEGPQNNYSGFYDKRVATWVRELDPGTSAPWTVAGFNAAQFGIKVG